MRAASLQGSSASGMPDATSASSRSVTYSKVHEASSTSSHVGGAGRIRPGTRTFNVQDPQTYQYLKRAIERHCPAWLRGHSDDLAQKASLKVFRLLSQSDQEYEVSAGYLHRVATTIVIDEIRSAQRRSNKTDSFEALEEHSAPGETGPHVDPENHLRSGRLGNEILECMARLLRDRRLAVTLKLQGYSNGESAKMLGWGEKKTENLASRGRADLRVCLRKKGVGIDESTNR